MSLKQLKHLKNSDKSSHETWDSPQNRKKINFPHPFRALVSGPPNSGKTTSILNILIGAQPIFDNIFIIHPEIFDPNIQEADEVKNEKILVEDCKIGEYKGVKFTAGLKYFPSPTYFDFIKDKKNLLIIDDVELRNYVKGKPYRASRINKLFSYTSTHRSLSIIITAQDIYSQLLPAIYRLCNVFVLYKFKDANQVGLIARNIGIKQDKLKQLFKLCRTNHDSITIDNTADSPYPYRFNILNPIEFKHEEQDSDEPEINAK